MQYITDYIWQINYLKQTTISIQSPYVEYSEAIYSAQLCHSKGKQNKIITSHKYPAGFFTFQLFPQQWYDVDDI